MTKTFWMMMTLFGVALPVATFMSRGEPFPSAPASVTVNSPPQLVFRRTDDAQLVQLADRMGFVKAPVIVIHFEEPSSSWGQSPEGLEWAQRLSLGQLHQEFKAACRASPIERRATIEGIERRRDEIRARASSACGWLSLAADEGHDLMFCERWRC